MHLRGFFRFLRDRQLLMGWHERRISNQLIYGSSFQEILASNSREHLFRNQDEQNTSVLSKKDMWTT